MGILAMAIVPSADTDTWWHLQAGKLIVEDGSILDQDPFSHTMQGEDWVYPGWIAQVVLFKIFDIFQFAGLNIFTGLMVLAAFLFIWPTLEGDELLKSFVLILAAATSGVYWSARPQILSFVFTGITICLLERARRSSHRSLWYIPILVMIWANVHGGFAIAFILLITYLVGDLIDLGLSIVNGGIDTKIAWTEHRDFVITIVGVGLVSLITLSINPHGPQMILYPFKTLSIGALQDYIAEWQSPNFHSLQSMPFLVMFMATWIALAISNRKITSIEIVIPVIFGLLSFTAVRNVGLFALATAPILSRHSENILQRISMRKKPSKPLPEKVIKGVNLFLFVFLGLMTFVKISTVLPIQTNLERIIEHIPISAFDYIEQQKPVGPIFNSYNWGGYLIWRLYPEYLAYVDGRTDLYGDEFLSTYLNIWLAGPGWDDELSERDIHLVIIEAQSPLAYALQGKGWTMEHEDDQAKVFSNP
jgi:hypothetical protein